MATALLLLLNSVTLTKPLTDVPSRKYNIISITVIIIMIIIIAIKIDVIINHCRLPITPFKHIYAIITNMINAKTLSWHQTINLV